MMLIVLQDGKAQTTVIAKVLVSDATEDMLSLFRGEVALVHEIKQHPNIVKYYGHVTKHIPAMLLSEYCQNGSLREFLRAVSQLASLINMRLTVV